MYFNTVSPSDFIENLKCFVCNNYLSQFPVYVTKNEKNVCGRCPIQKEAIHMRNEIYELIARQIEFPCRYSAEGCFQRFFPKDVPNHEQQCPYRVVNCPTKKFTGCTTHISYPDLRQHCEESHSDVLLKNGEFNIDLSESIKTLNFLIHREAFFVFECKFDAASKKMNCIVTCVEGACDKMSYFYKIILKNDYRSLSLESYIGKGISESDTHKICLEVLASTCYYDNTISGKVILDKEEVVPQARSVDEDLLNLFKCASCKTYIKPPVRIYLSGQTKCGTCVSNYDYPITNASFDKVTSQIIYPCKFKENGCTFTSQPLLMTDHEPSCLYGNQKCPISEYVTCSWNGFQKDVQQHILETHNETVIDIPEISENVANTLTKCYFVRFSNCFFRLVFCFDNSNYLWAMQMIGQFKDDFKFEIEVLDGNHNGKKLLNRQSCVSLSPKNQVFQNFDRYCYFTANQVKDLISSDKFLKFKFHIFK